MTVSFEKLQSEWECIFNVNITTESRSNSNVFAQGVIYKFKVVSSYISEVACSLLLKGRTEAYFEMFLC